MSDAMNEPEIPGPEKKIPWKKITVLVLLVAAIIVGITQFGDSLTLASLSEKEGQLREYQSDHPALVYGVAFLVYVTVTGLSLPGAAPLTLVYAWYFGLLRGVILVSFASTMGATLAFLLSLFISTAYAILSGYTYGAQNLRNNTTTTLIGFYNLIPVWGNNARQITTAEIGFFLLGGGLVMALTIARYALTWRLLSRGHRIQPE